MSDKVRVLFDVPEHLKPRKLYEPVYVTVEEYVYLKVTMSLLLRLINTNFKTKALHIISRITSKSMYEHGTIRFAKKEN